MRRLLQDLREIGSSRAFFARWTTRDSTVGNDSAGREKASSEPSGIGYNSQTTLGFGLMQSAAQSGDFDDDDYLPAPPSRSEQEHDDRVDAVLAQLEQAGRGEHAAWCLSNALDSLRHRRASLLSPLQRDQLLRAAALAHVTARRKFPASYSREQIDVGMGALAGLIVFWSECIEQRESTAGRTNGWTSSTLRGNSRTTATIFASTRRSMSARPHVGPRRRGRSWRALAGLWRHERAGHVNRRLLDSCVEFLLLYSGRYTLGLIDMCAVPPQMSGLTCHLP